ncbi:glycosyltransferase family 2 protein [Actibacterium lipolyticum]|uniref:Putative glycosyltransferase EpsH n=1 Tax=Actibacterium lipolyticum TaxID=1524263 RepID=A0A238KWK9_9RHOB|nr:glycosyltransferase family 2 protein [Actibacterium lipolyticum]SMX46466.1 Putative glycosyltransferase EpsH [Actibacterium lipolyticum]
MMKPLAAAAPQSAVIIPHFNDHTRLKRCLDALLKGGLSSVEVLVVDNGSTPPIDTLSARFPTVRFVTEPTKGAAAARNRGVQESTAQNLFFLDADCVPAPDWLATAKQVVRPNAVIGGRVDVFDEGSGPRTGAQAFETVFAFAQKAYVEEKGFSVTANLLTTRDVFSDVGPFVVGVSEDFDWCQRATAKGYALTYADALAVSHPTRTDWAGLRKKWRRLTDESFGLIKGQKLGRIKWAARALAMPVSIIAHIPKILTHRSLSTPQERYRAIATLARLRLLRAGWMLAQAIRG